MQIEQFVMAYGVEHDRLRAILPDGYASLRPVLRINAEIQNDDNGYVEFNTAVEKDGNRGWLNIGYWNNVPFEKTGKTVTFRTEFLVISFTGVGVEGSCPVERDNAGCYFTGDKETLRKPETINASKEFCDCEFRWKFTDADAHGKSIGKTLPAVLVEIVTLYPKEDFTVENAARIPCEQVLGTYVVTFNRQSNPDSISLLKNISKL